MEEQRKQGMESLFIPYNLALKLKEKGFDEECLAYWSEGFLYLKTSSGLEHGIKNQDLYHTKFLAPLYQQIIDWFREKHKIIPSVDRYLDKDKLYYKAFIQYSNGSCSTALHSENNPSHSSFAFNSYYSALTKALEEAFKLI